MPAKVKVTLRNASSKLKIKLEGKEAKEFVNEVKPEVKQQVLYRYTTRPKED